MMFKNHLMIILCMMYISLVLKADQIWVQRYNGTGNGNDNLLAMKIDNLGNVYVTGSSGSSQNDIVTIKYNSNGVQQWLQRYSSYDDAEGNSIALDISGNIYVAGGVYGTFSTTGILIKYNNSGVQQWVMSFEHASERALVIDSDGNVIVAGEVDSTGNREICLTVKYNSSGTQIWAKTYQGPGTYFDFLNLNINLIFINF